jgi:hypothetical protein
MQLYRYNDTNDTGDIGSLPSDAPVDVIDAAKLYWLVTDACIAHCQVAI